YEQGRAAVLEGSRARPQNNRLRLVPRHRFGDGADPEHGGGDGRLYAVGSRHLAQFQEPAKPEDRRRRRPPAVQPIWLDAGQPGAISFGQAGSGLQIYQLADFADRPEDDRRLQDRRSAIVLSQRRALARMSAAMKLRTLVLAAATCALTMPVFAQPS